MIFYNYNSLLQLWQPWQVYSTTLHRHSFTYVATV